MKKLLASVLIPSLLTVSACGSAPDDNANSSDNPDATSLEEVPLPAATAATMTGPNDTTSAAGAGVETGAMEAATNGTAGADGDPATGASDSMGQSGGNAPNR